MITRQQLSNKRVLGQAYGHYTDKQMANKRSTFMWTGPKLNFSLIRTFRNAAPFMSIPTGHGPLTDHKPPKDSISISCICFAPQRPTHTATAIIRDVVHAQAQTLGVSSIYGETYIGLGTTGNCVQCHLEIR